MAAILFAVHPIHTEAVTGVVGRAELLRDNTLLIITMRTQLFDLLPLDQIFFLFPEQLEQQKGLLRLAPQNCSFLIYC